MAESKGAMEAVKAVYPKAAIVEDGMIYTIITGTGKLVALGRGTTSLIAWSDAARRIVPAPEVGEATNEAREIVDAMISNLRHNVAADNERKPSATPVAEVLGPTSAIEALEDLLEAIPKQTNDADWWPDELTFAVRRARKAVDEAYGGSK